MGWGLFTEGASGDGGGTSGYGWDGGGGGDAWCFGVGGGGGGRCYNEDRCASSSLSCGYWCCGGGGGAWELVCPLDSAVF
jgi:hypothetical protein